MRVPIEITIHFLVKRFLDAFLSLLALVVSAPVFTVIAVLIKLESQGPVFIRQERVGLKGRRFELLKFRSMYVEPDEILDREYVFKILNKVLDPKSRHVMDPRMTPLGRFLQLTFLVELPQLINVLKGDMSLVGPIPLTPYEWERYYGRIRERLKAKPGVTGIGQILSSLPMYEDEQLREAELEYIRHPSILKDLRLILASARVVLFGRGVGP